MNDKMKGVKRSNKRAARIIATAGIILLIVTIVLIVHTGAPIVEVLPFMTLLLSMFLMLGTLMYSFIIETRG